MEQTHRVFDGNIDEVAVFNALVSQILIRDWMCKKITILHTSYANLEAYYKFDENSRSALTDHKGTNNGKLINGIKYSLSSTPIGDQNVYQYSTSSSMTLTHTDGDNLTINSFTGTSTGDYVYKIDAVPNTLTGTQGVGTNDKCFGVFEIGDTSATYTAIYDYTGDPDVGINEPDLVLFKKNDNASLSLIQPLS